MTVLEFGKQPSPGLPRMIRDMHLVYGTTELKQCGDCVHFQRLRVGNTRCAKCELARQSRSRTTDWRAHWRACGKFETGRTERVQLAT